MARGTYFAGDAFLDSLYSTYGTQPTTDPEAAKVYSALVSAHQRLYAGLNKSEIDRELRTLSEQVKTFRSVKETAAELAETRARSSRVTSQNITKTKAALLEASTELAKALSAKSPAWDAAMQAAGVNPDKPNALAAAAALTKWMDSFGKPLSPTSPDLVPMMNRMSMTVLGKPLNQATPEELVAALGADAPGSVTGPIRDLAQSAKTRENDLRIRLDLVKKDQEFLDKNGSALANLSAGAPGAKKLYDELGRIGDSLEGNLMAALGRSAADIEAQRELTVNRNAEIEESQRRIDRMEVRAYGKEGRSPQEKMGRLMATPQFQEWAAANGYKVGDYFITEDGKLASNPGQDDKAALRQFLYQAGRTDKKYGPFLASKSTGVLVKVTAQDPEEKARVMRQYKGTNGSYYVNAQGDLVKPGMAQDELERGGYIPSVEMSGDGKYFKKPDGTVVGRDGQPTSAPSGTQFFPAIKADAQRRPAGYATVADIKDAATIEATNIGVDDGTLEDADKAALDAHIKGAPYSQATEDQVKTSWTGSYTGYLDRPHARDVLEGKTGGSVISLDGGRVTIPGGRPATIEVLEAREPGVIAGVVRAFNKFMPEKHVEDLRSKGMLQELPEAEAVRLGEEQLARFNAPGAPTPEVPTDVMTSYRTPTGKEEIVAVPVGSQAADVAQRTIGRDVVPITAAGAAAAAAPATTAAPAPGAPAAPATKPAPGAAPSTARTMKDDKGNVFSVTDDKITFVSPGEGQKVPTKKEWAKNSEVGKTIMGILDANTPKEPTPAAPKTAPTSALPKVDAKTRVTAPAETEPEIGARGSAAVVVPGKKAKPTTDEEDVERYVALRAAEQAKAEKAKPETPYVPKPIEDGQRFREQDETLPISGAQKAADESFLRKVAARTGRPELVSRMEGLRVMQGKNPLLYEQMLKETGGLSIEQMAAEERRKLRPKSGEPLKTVDAYAAGTTGYQPERVVQGAKPGTLDIAPPGSETVTAEAEFETPTPAPTSVAQPKLSLWKRLTGKNTNQPSGAQE